MPSPSIPDRGQGLDPTSTKTGGSDFARAFGALSPRDNRRGHDMQALPFATMPPVTPARRNPPPSKDADPRAQGWARFQEDMPLRRWSLLLLALVPFASHASGDPVIGWWMGGAALVHVAAFACWFTMTLRRRATATSMVAFAGVCGMAWWAYLASHAVDPAPSSLALIAVPPMFIALELASGTLQRRFRQPLPSRAQAASASRSIGRP